MNSTQKSVYFGLWRTELFYTFFGSTFLLILQHYWVLPFCDVTSLTAAVDFVYLVVSLNYFPLKIGVSILHLDHLETSAFFSVIRISSPEKPVLPHLLYCYVVIFYLGNAFFKILNRYFTSNRILNSQSFRE